MSKKRNLFEQALDNAVDITNTYDIDFGVSYIEREGGQMSRYMEDKKLRERLVSELLALCKRHGYELDEEQQRRFKRMKTDEVCEFSSKLLTRLNQRTTEAWKNTDQAVRALINRNGGNHVD